MRNRRLTFLLLLLIGTVFSVDLIAAGKGGTRGGLPSCLVESMNAKPLLKPTADYLMAHSNVTSAANFCSLNPAVLQWFLVKLEESASTGLAPDVSLPQEYLDMVADGSDLTTNYVTVTSNAAETFGAQLAHRFFVELGGFFPWHLHDYSSEDLKKLVSFCGSRSGCADITPSYSATNILNHSPRAAFDLAREMMIEHGVDPNTLVDKAQTIGGLLRHTRLFRHGGRFYDSSGNLLRDDSRGIVTLEKMAEEKISRHGCWSMSLYLVDLADALNIPGRQAGNYAGNGHASAFFEGISKILVHGDDPYTAILDNTPSALLMDDVSRLPKNPSPTTWYNAWMHTYTMARLYPSEYLMERYCFGFQSPTSGRAYLEDAFTDEYGTYATPAELDDLEFRINAITSGCLTIPPDDPEN